MEPSARKLLLAGVPEYSLPLPTETSAAYGRMTDSLDTAEAIEQALQGGSYAVLIVEEDLLDATVVELCTRIRATTSTTKVGIIGLARESDKQRIDALHRAPLNAVLTRPLDAGAFVQTLEKFLTVADRRKLRVLARLDGPKIDGELFARCLNISTTGILLQLDRTLLPDTMITCRLYLPGSLQRVTVMLQITRCTSAADSVSVGARFVDLTESDEQLIAQYVAGEGLA